MSKMKKKKETIAIGDLEFGSQIIVALFNSIVALGLFWVALRLLKAIVEIWI